MAGLGEGEQVEAAGYRLGLVSGGGRAGSERQIATLPGPRPGQQDFVQNEQDQLLAELLRIYCSQKVRNIYCLLVPFSDAARILYMS